MGTFIVSMPDIFDAFLSTTQRSRPSLLGMALTYLLYPLALTFALLLAITPNSVAAGIVLYGVIALVVGLGGISTALMRRWMAQWRSRALFLLFITSTPVVAYLGLVFFN